MFSERAFFSFVDLAPESSHRAYNEWHQLDHRPENLLLDGVAWGDRWARTDRCAQVGSASGGPDRATEEFAGTDYVAMYWFRPPYEESVAEWTALGEASHQWGRGPRLSGVRRPLTAFFTPVKGYVAPRVLVSPDALPFRPNRGLHLTLTRFADHHGAAAHDHFARQDRVTIPELLELDGVAGAWTFSFLGSQRHPTLGLNDPSDHAPGELRIRLLYLDGDPVETGTAIDSHLGDEGADGVAEVLLSTPLSTIIPWQDW
ncbi:hypothetical protein ncot_08000 [Nocardioides sp. JQ2195]|uniref:hypothetical protein n=1 Tax=Nocardioides sp. JQ2195 TaxID=2592334 RepID=UPI00143EF256|nr:hypothetical protein [Nocardioides sp. JQ2195]QIX26551.1 hypothetical protein ncot_08000 [Nocardioides sp. JQ2195]